MRQVFVEKGIVVVKEVSQPLLDDHSVLVSVHYSCISSGTEIATIKNAQDSMLTNVPYKIKKVIESVVSHGFDGTKALIKSTLVGQTKVIGYSCSGRVIAVGSKVTKFFSGDLVACAGEGLANHADIICVPENLVAKVSAQEYLKSASLTTMGAIALQGIRRAQVQLGEVVCVVGLGLLGHLTVQLAKLSGCTVIGIDLIPERLASAKECGADYVYAADDEQLTADINFLTHHYGVDTTIITAASESDTIMQQAMEITRKKGKVVLVGDVGLHIAREPFYKKEIDFLISCSYGPGSYDASYEKKGHDYPYAYVRWTENRNMQAFIQLIESGKIKIDTLVSQETDLEDIVEAYEHIQKHKSLGIIVRYGKKSEATVRDFTVEPAVKALEFFEPQSVRFIPARKDTMRVGIVGAGSFAKIKLIPALAKINGVKISAIVDADVTNALSVTKLYGAAHALVNDQDLFKDDLVDVVVIASPHKFHYEQAIHALQNGKAVFMEKPMVTNLEQFSKLNDFLTLHPEMPFCVDYNRSFSPYMQKVKQAVVGRHAPMVIHYRMNAGFIPKEHWIQTDSGAGRIIGEACHILDLFCFLTDSKPLAVSVEALHSSNDDLFPTDNFSAQISFEDGSICSLLYTALGHSQLGKERMELFFDSKTIVMDDYTQLHGFGFPSTFHATTAFPDTGHEALLHEFFANIKKPVFKSPISLQRLNTVAELTLAIDTLACQGGGMKELIV
ncbi:MAG: bi-domain-containing oxidoreductase [Candidatus Dependentiae bacterium]|nr:bi-domain-containing oxidoreductase [Candidatus Dependentiae bacterium]